MVEKDELIKILGIWNIWNNSFNKTISRLSYEKKISQLRSVKEIIVLKGVRRSGKSTLLELEIKNLLENTNKENILFINFEEPRFINNLNVEFMDYIYETYLEYLEPQGRVYIFLDEVQNIIGWEKWVLRMYEKKNVQIYVTGSSSKLLSSEFSTALSGRHLSIEVFPLSFKEFLNFNSLEVKSRRDIVLNDFKIKKIFKEYLEWGGFPKIFDIKNNMLKREELLSYYDTIILKDIAKRYNIGNVSDLRKLSFYLLSNIAKQYSVNNLKNLGLGSYETIKKYIDYLKESYLLFDLELYDVSVKRQVVNPKKIYVIDLGFISAVSFKFSENKGRMLENLVFLELKRRRKEIYYHKNKKECDFVIKEGLKIKEAIQVTYSLNNQETQKREIEGLLDAICYYNLDEGIILTLDEEREEIVKKDNKDVKIIIKPIWKWLLE